MTTGEGLEALGFCILIGLACLATSSGWPLLLFLFLIAI